MVYNDMKNGDIVEFNQAKFLQYIRPIGSGGTGSIHLFEDEITNMQFALKKYLPSEHNESQKKAFFNRFIDEIKILFQLSHPNVVRIYNYYLYPEKLTGYIQMEYVDGTNISEYLSINPLELTRVFREIIGVFKSFENNGVLHRDIRPDNFLITHSGELKVIDFGFGKILKSENESNSIFLNWPVDEDAKEVKEFSHYDKRTEMYYIAKMFEKINSKSEIAMIINKMSEYDYLNRFDSFDQIELELANNIFVKTDFNSREKSQYLLFANELTDALLVHTGEYTPKKDFEIILSDLEQVYQRNVLEDFVTNNSSVIKCFIKNSYRYNTKARISLKSVRGFIEFLNNSSNDKKKIIIENIHHRLSNLEVEYNIDDLPF
ncbi:protein kinase family protein [Brochothrix thermosphacta]|uniref:protein kinase family protein n=1 Tax=Brochothrix thermosphacta TaxID=2756 RepID=UPI003F966BE3